MKTNLTFAQQKIYDDKHLLSDTELLNIVNNDDKYLYDVVYVAKLILIERGTLSLDNLEETQAKNAESILGNMDLILDVDGPPFDKNFKSNSIVIIVLAVVTSIISRLIPVENPEILIIVSVLMIGICIWSAVIASNYLKKIKRGKGLAVLCFFTPFIGLFIVRSISIKIEHPGIKEIYTKAKNYFDHHTKQIRTNKESVGVTRDDMMIELKDKVNSGLQKKSNEFLTWLGYENSTKRSDEEIRTKINEMILEYQFESEPIPILDMTFETNVPAADAEIQNICPACGYVLKPDDATCPDCGINLR